MTTAIRTGVALCTLLATAHLVQNQTSRRTITIQAAEVTSPTIAASPDGRSLVVSALGHLFQLPVTGGAATQLTSGPSFNTDPAFSPDGRRVAFVSNRDGSSSNVFVLDLASKQVTQLSREIEAGRPAWGPDGRTIAFVRNIPREAHPPDILPGFGDTGLREIHLVNATGGASTAVGEPQAFESIFYLPDGRLAWTVRELGPGGMFGPQVKQTRVEAKGPDGKTTVLASAAGNLGRVVPSPRGDGIHYVARGAAQFLPFSGAATASAGPAIRDADARLTVAPDGAALFFGDRGGLWRAALSSGELARIPFTAAITLEVQPRVQPTWTAPPLTPGAATLRPVLAPGVSPDGARVVFMAAGFLWEQSLSGGTARQLVKSGAFCRDPAYSPDGRSIVFSASENGRRELRVLDRETGQARVLFSTGGAAWPLHPSWSPDGKQIVFQHAQALGAPFAIVTIGVGDRQTRELTQTVGSWVARPHFSGDGRWVYFTNRSGKIGTLNRISVEPGAKPEVLSDVSRHVHEALVSPDGRRMAQRRNSEIWIATMRDRPITDGGLRRLSAEGGRSFAFTPDSTAIVYAAGGRLWRQNLNDAARTEIAVNVGIPRAIAPPLLVRRIRVLDLAAGSFSGETAMFVENGRIQWIGAEDSRRVPSNTITLDGGGRFAIPGLFDAHVHSAWQNQQTNEDAFIAFGITSVRDTGGTLELLTALDDRSNSTALAAPRYFYSGEIFEGMMPLWGDAFYTIGSEAEARAEVRHLKAAGADFVKLYPSLPWNLQQIVSDEAHRAQLPIVGHGLSLEETVRRVLWGSTSIEHSNGVYGSYEDVHKLLAAAETATDLTLSVGGGSLMVASDPEWRTNWRVQEFVPETMRRGRVGGGPMALGSPDQPRAELLTLFRPRFERLMSARGHGVQMTGGTDSLMGGVFFGLALHWEIAQFADAGVPPLDVLRMATAGSAALVGASADLGSLTVGKLADIVLLDASPLENIRNTQKIWQVVKGGRLYDPAKLRPGVAGTAAR